MKINFLTSLLIVVCMFLVGCEKTPEEARKELISRGVTIEDRALVDSARTGNIEVVRLFATASSLSENTGSEPMEFGAALVAASEEGHQEVVQELLEAGINPNAREGEALLKAAENSHSEVCMQLIEYGADPSLNRSSALLAAISQGNVNIVDLFLEADAGTSIDGSRPISVAIQSDEDVLANKLIDEFDSYDKTAIFEEASLNGSIQVMREVIQDEYDPSDALIRDYARRSVANGNPEVAIFLYDKFEDIEHLKKWHLVTIASAIDPSTLRPLLEAGFPTNPSSMQPSYRTPLANAVWRHTYSNIDLLLEHGADPNYHMERIEELKRNGEHRGRYSIDTYTWKNDPLFIAFCRGEWSEVEKIADGGGSFRMVEHALAVHENQFFDTLRSFESYFSRNCRAAITSRNGRNIIAMYSR